MKTLWSMNIVIQIGLDFTIHMWIKYCSLVTWTCAIINVYKMLHMQHQTQNRRETSQDNKEREVRENLGERLS